MLILAVKNVYSHGSALLYSRFGFYFGNEPTEIFFDHALSLVYYLQTIQALVTFIKYMSINITNSR